MYAPTVANNDEIDLLICSTSVITFCFVAPTGSRLFLLSVVALATGHVLFRRRPINAVSNVS